jgi:AcrR family transcriptional regulator
MLDAAETLLLADGLEALNIRRVAGRVGLSSTMIYHQFGGKAELLDALAHRLLDRSERDLVLALASAQAPRDRWRKVSAWADALAQPIALLLHRRIVAGDPALRTRLEARLHDPALLAGERTAQRAESHALLCYMIGRWALGAAAHPQPASACEPLALVS